jgi:hypothetical protein
MLLVSQDRRHLFETPRKKKYFPVLKIVAAVGDTNQLFFTFILGRRRYASAHGLHKFLTEE